MINAQTVLDFWFKELEPRQWWVKDCDLDQLIKQRFLNTLTQACKCELFHWRDSAQGRLAEVIVLDQFSRNIYRDKPESFANDSLALALAQETVAAGLDQKLSPVERSFLYLPYMHSESAAIHEQAVTLYQANGIADNLEFEYKHKAIIDRFGRYPHRNAILGRQSSAEELAFLQQPGSSF